MLRRFYFCTRSLKCVIVEKGAKETVEKCALLWISGRILFFVHNLDKNNTTLKAQGIHLANTEDIFRIELINEGFE